MADYEDDEQVMFEDEGETAIEESALKPVSKRRSSNQSSAAEETGLQCPVCSRILSTDNSGLNEHIDFCLSKGAIMAATAV